MTNIDVSPEDRERLAKSKFGEWFDEFFEKKFEEAFEKKAGTIRRERTQTTSAPVASQEEDAAPRPRRRSLLETCLSDTFGF